MGVPIPFSCDTVYFAKVNPGATIPSRNDEDGCYDLYTCKDFDGQIIKIKPLQTKLVRTGIASAFSPKYRIQLRKRGSNTKWRTLLNAGEIDSGYRGEWFVAIVNTSLKIIELRDDIENIKHSLFKIQYPISKAICQFAVEEVPQISTATIPYKVLREIPSKRGIGKLGDSGK